MEQYSETKEAFEDDQTGQSGVSDGGIRVPEPEDHYSNSPTMPFIPFVRSHSILFSPLLSSLFILVTGLSLIFVEPTTTTAPTQRRGRGRKHGVSHNRGHSTLPSRPRGRCPGRSSSQRQGWHASYCILSQHSLLIQ